MKKVSTIATLASLCLGLMTACGRRDASDESASPTSSFSEPFAAIQYYYSTVEKIGVEILYEQGAEPYIGNLVSGKSYWTLLQDNIDALFKTRATAPTASVPSTIAQMTAIPVQGKATWTTTDLTELAVKYRKNSSTAKAAYFTLVFVKGYADKEGVADKAVIGFSVTGTPFIAMFKDVIDSLGEDSATSKYVEQSTLIHEMGHALGLVNNGVRMSTSHQDTANGKHCTKDTCVMYWQNEGSKDLRQFVRKIQKTGNTVMFGDECLADTRAYVP